MPLMLTDTLRDWDEGRNSEFHWSRLPELLGADNTLTLRNNLSFADVSMTYTEYAAYLAREDEPSAQDTLFYGKDLVAPAAWVDATHRNLPAYLHEKCDGDALACPARPDFAPETLMTYIGVNGSHTCAHFDICASLGHNLLLESDAGPTSIWFIVRTQDHAVAAEFWRQRGGSLFTDNCFLFPEALARAPFPIYVVLQGRGDLVLVPPMAAHQVFNKGRNVKISWNRLPPASLELAYFDVLPRYREVARSEVYRVVGLTYYALLRWEQVLRALLQDWRDTRAAREADSSPLLDFHKVVTTPTPGSRVQASDVVCSSPSSPCFLFGGPLRHASSLVASRLPFLQDSTALEASIASNAAELGSLIRVMTDFIREQQINLDDPGFTPTDREFAENVVGKAYKQYDCDLSRNNAAVAPKAAGSESSSRKGR